MAKQRTPKKRDGRSGRGGGPGQGGADASYLAGDDATEESVAYFFKAAAALYGVDLWESLDAGEALRVDIPELGVRGGCLVVAGAETGDSGLMLFPSLEGLQAFATAIQAQVTRGQELAALGSSFLSLYFEDQSHVPPSMRREIEEHRWPIAGPAAHPVLLSHGADGGPRLLSDRDVRVMAACASALAAFVDKNRAALAADGDEPIVETHLKDEDPVVILALPYEAADWGDARGPAPEPRRAPPSVGRNDPCPCGSGRKYKKCHLLSDEAGGATDGQRQRSSLHDLDNRLVVEMRTFAKRRFPDEWAAHLDDMFEVFDDPDANWALSGPWAIYMAPFRGSTVAGTYLAERGRNLVGAERQWLELQGQSWLSVWEVLDVDPGRSVAVRDLLTGAERRVDEAEGTRTLVRRDALLARVVDHPELSIFCGVHQHPLPPLAAAAVVDQVRAKLRRKTALPPERLRDAATARHLIGCWEEAVESMKVRANVPPQLHNTDGDKLVLTTEVFELSPAHRADVDARVVSLEGGDRWEEGDEVKFAFFRGAPVEGEGPSEAQTIIGHARLAANELRVETDSSARADALRARLEQACGGLIVHQRREQVDPLAPRLVDEAAPKVERPPPSPAAIEAMRALKRQHYEGWADQPLPALAGKTPRDALRSAEGRAALDRMLKDFEYQENRLAPEVRFDMSELRRALGLSG